MLKLKRLRLKNFCQYIDHTFNFTKENGDPYQFICFFGPNGIGKCLASSCYINTYEYGMIEIGELFRGQNLTPDTWYKKSFSIDVNGSFESVKNIYYSGKKKTVRLITKRGYTVEGSYDLHSILSLQEKINFQKLNKLSVGDVVCISRKSTFPEQFSISSTMSKILGYLISEGCINKNVRFFNSDQEINHDFCQAIKREFDCLVYSRKYETSYYTTVPSKLHASLFKAGLSKSKSGDKTVPNPVLSGTQEIISTFLQAYFEGDGGVEKGIKAVTCASKSYKLLHQIQLLLLRLGIVSSLRKKYVNKLSYANKSYTSWRITIQGKDVKIFAEKIGFVSSRKKNELKEIVHQIGDNPNYDVIPSKLCIPLIKKVREHAKKIGITFKREDYKNTKNGLHCLQDNYLNLVKKGISKNKLNSCFELSKFSPESDPDLWWLKEDFFFDEVESIEFGEDDLFDVCVEEKHAFWSNGFISHNSTLLEAISLLTSDHSGRNAFMVQNSFAKYIRSEDYDPTYNKITKQEDNEPQMLVEGVYGDGDKEYTVSMTENGWVRNDFAPTPNPEAEPEDAKRTLESGPWGSEHLRYRRRVCHFVTSDSDLSLNRFQLHCKYVKQFERIVEEITRYKTECIAPSWMSGSASNKEYCTDLVLIKKEHRIHYKRMSLGERKICKSFSELLNLMHALESDPKVPMIGWPRILLMDELETHVYYNRHVSFVNCLKDVFNKQQIFATTHSGVLVPRFLAGDYDKENELWFDLDKING